MEGNPRTKGTKGSERVLLVDDDESVRDVIRKFLENEEYTVIEARDCKEAIEICERSEHPIQLLITEVALPQMTGPQLAECVKSVHHEIKVLYVSGSIDDAFVDYGIPEGDPTFLLKPFSLRPLMRKVREVLESAKEDKALE